MIKRIGVGARMSEAVIHGQTVYLAGQVGEGATVAEQTKDCLRQVDEILAKAGTSKENILQTIIWLADMADFHAQIVVNVNAKTLLPRLSTEVHIFAHIGIWILSVPFHLEPRERDFLVDFHID